MRKRRLLAIGAVLTVTAGAAITFTMSTGFAGLRHGSAPDAEETEEVVARPAATTGSCGVERWSVKTGTDADKGLINLSSNTPTTISYLDGLPAPSSLPSNNRVQPTETTVYQLNATLTEYKLEADSDYHLVLNDGAGHTMIAEIPDPACVGAGSPLTSGIQKARSEFDAKYTPTGSFQSANVPVTVTGVGFFDFLHGQTGVAPNGIELHAVLDVNFGGAPPPSVSVTNPGAQTGTVGTAANLQLSANGGTAPYSWTAAGLPAGLAINASTGQITGTPTAAGTSTVTATAKDSTNASGSTTFTWTINPSGGGGCTAAQLLGNPGFETGANAPWTSNNPVVSSDPTEPPHSGAYDAWLDGYGTTHTDTLQQAVTIPSGCANDTLSFWLHVDTAEPTTAAYDNTLTVQLLDGSGAVLTTLGTFSNKDAAAGYAQHSYLVGAYAGKAVTLKFTGTEDYTKQTSFVLDDTALDVR